MIESLPSFLIVQILESIGLISLRNILISSRKINIIYHNSQSIILINKKEAIQTLKKIYKEKSPNHRLRYASKIADMETIDMLISGGINAWDWGMLGAAEGGPGGAIRESRIALLFYFRRSSIFS